MKEEWKLRILEWNGGKNRFGSKDWEYEKESGVVEYILSYKGYLWILLMSCSDLMCFRSRLAICFLLSLLLWICVEKGCWYI